MAATDFAALTPAQAEAWRGPMRIRVPGWGNARPSIAEEVGMQAPSPSDYLRQLGPKVVDEMVAKTDRVLPRDGVEL